MLQNQKMQMEFKVTEDKTPIRHQKLPKTIFNVIVLCCSSWYFGYTLVQISCIPTNVLQSAFTTRISNAATLGVLIGFYTIGCAAGTFLSSYMLENFSRKNFILLVNVLALITSGVIQITDIYALGTCRIFQGVVSGCYMKVIPLYIQEITPNQIGWMFAHWPQILTVLGFDVAYALELIFTAGQVGVQSYWRVIFIIPAFVVILQSILLILFVPNSPLQKIQENKLDEARDIYKKIYKDEHLDEVMQQNIKKLFIKKVRQMNACQYMETKKNIMQISQLKQPFTSNDAQLQRSPQLKQISQIPQKQTFRPETSEEAQLTYNLDKLRQNFTSAQIFLGLILAQSLHMTGILAIITQAGQLQSQFSSYIGEITPVVIISVQFFFTILSVFAIRGIGLYLNILLGLAIMGLTHCINGILFIFISWKPAIVLTFVVFIINMIIFGCNIGNSIGMAIGQLMPHRMIPYAQAISWLGASFCIIALPIVMNASNKNGYPAFFFFGAWCLCSSVISLIFIRKIRKFR